MPLLFMLSGCAPTPVLNNNPYNKSNLQKKLEKKVLAVSLKLTGVSSKNIKDLLHVKPASGIPAVPAKSKGSNRIYPYMPPFMVKTSDIKHSKSYEILVNKTVKSRGGKLFFKVNSVKFKNIFEIINFSIKNLHISPVKFRLILFKKTAAGAKYIPFESNAGGPANSYIAGHTEIKGSIIFVKRRKSAGLRLGVLMFAKSRINGKIKFVKLIYKFAGWPAHKTVHGKN
ncbi:MAG: hypothetical protein ACYCSQ_04680 [bacterium]